MNWSVLTLLLVLILFLSAITTAENQTSDSTTIEAEQEYSATGFGSVEVTSDPSGALASVDGGLKYSTPYTFTDISPGYHSVYVAKAGYTAYKSEVYVTEGTNVPVYAVLRPMTTSGILYVSSVPSGADVYLDTNFIGVTPIQEEGVSIGTHTVVVKLAGYQVWKTSVTITSEKMTSVEAKLSPSQAIYGSLEIASTPVYSSVYLNGNMEGQTPSSGYLNIPDIIPGSYDLKVSCNCEEYQDYEEIITINGGQTSTLSIHLNPMENAKPSATQASGNTTVMIDSNPTGADVLLNNIYYGITPISLSTITPGNYTLLIKEIGYEDYNKDIQVVSGQVLNIQADLSPKHGAKPNPVPTQSGLSPLLGIIGIMCAGILLLVKKIQ